MNFVAIDFETANPNFASICQVGAVLFRDGAVASELDTLVNPEDYFHGMNVSIHKITEEIVKDAPKFPDVYQSLSRLLDKQVVVSHTSFDRVALSRAIAKYQLSPIECVWLDSAKVTRRTWSQFAHKGYGLKSVAKVLGIQYQHHVAKEDARAAGEVLLRALAETGVSLADLLVRVNQPICASSHDASIAPKAGSDGPLGGEVLVFTGALCMVRAEAADLAAKAGATVGNSVTKETTLLVVGDQDISKLAGHEKSSKHRKAEELIAKGQALRIIGETDFLHVARLA